jgi:predicted nucleotidyltransferase component of viral defense system
MIGRDEILRVANTLGLEPRVVEKDYVLGWVLHGIARDPVLGGSWVFKGGTCLKKCYFETYRFSEDLDFTVTDSAQLSEEFLLERFRAIGAQLYDETGIELPAELLRFKIWPGKYGKPAGEGRVSYRGPIAPRGGDLPRIKIDLTADEILVLPPVIRSASHAYSDLPADGMAVRCYAFEEVFGEKVRALGERARPRDLYDVVNLFRNGEFQAAAGVIRDVLRQKCAFKSIRIPTFEALGGFAKSSMANGAICSATSFHRCRQWNPSGTRCPNSSPGWAARSRRWRSARIRLPPAIRYCAARPAPSGSRGGSRPRSR